MRKFLLEAALKEAAVLAGCREAAINDFELDVQDHRITSAAEIPAWILKAKEQYPHRFVVQDDTDAELASKAFLFGGNKTAQGTLWKAVGAERFEELKNLFANGLPESEKKRLNGSADHKTNPWRGTPDNLIPGTNKYSAKAFASQVSCVRALGVEKAAALAAACGAKLGDVRAPRVSS